MNRRTWRDLAALTALGAITAAAGTVYVITEAAHVIRHGRRGRTPAPGNTRAPAPHPVPGQQPSPAPAHGRTSPRPAPAPATEPRLLMSSRFYSDGVVFVDDHIKHVTRRFDPPPDDDDDWDAAFERLQAGDHPDGF